MIDHQLIWTKFKEVLDRKQIAIKREILKLNLCPFQSGGTVSGLQLHVYGQLSLLDELMKEITKLERDNNLELLDI